MEGLNRVTLLGNLGADPELRMTSGGQAVLKMRMATSETYLDRDKKRQERTEWHSVVVWGKRAEGLAKLLGKGSRLLVDGRIQTQSYEKDGEKRYRTEVVANDVLLQGGGPDRRAHGGAASPSGEVPDGPSGSYGEVPDDDIPF